MAWLSRKTGKPSRLLSEAEFEYAALHAPDNVLSDGVALVGKRTKKSCKIQFDVCLSAARCQSNSGREPTPKWRDLLDDEQTFGPKEQV